MLTRHSRSASAPTALICTATPITDISISLAHAVPIPAEMSTMKPTSLKVGFSRPKTKEHSSTATGVEALSICTKATVM